MLNWTSLVSSRDQKFLVKGTELACAIVPNHHSRFALYEVRRYVTGDNGKWWSDVGYRIRDAATVSDADLKNGKRPRVVFEAEGMDEALAAVERLALA